MTSQKAVFNEIANMVTGMVQKAILSTSPGNTPISTQMKSPQDSAPNTGKEGEENANSGEKDGEISPEDPIFVVQQYFERMNANNGNTLRPILKRAEKELGGVVYNTWNPLGDMADAEEDRIHHGPILFSGVLWKQGKRPNIWKERFFILRETGLSYYTHKDPFTIDAVKRSIAKETNSPAPAPMKAPPKGSLVHKNTIYLKRGNDDLLTSRNINIADALKDEAPHPRGNVFFVDVVTPGGRVVDDLSWMNKAMVGNKDHAFLIQTHDSMFVLAAREQDDKVEWAKEVGNAYHRFVNNMIRKVAIMELSWSFGEEFEKFEVDTAALIAENSKTPMEEVKIEKPGKAGKTLKGKTMKPSKGTKKNTKRKFGTRKNKKTMKNPEPEPAPEPEVKPAAEEKPDPKGLIHRLMKNTLERTKKRVLGEEKANEVTVAPDARTAEEERRIKKQITKAKRKARGSLSRMQPRDRLRLSSKRVGVVLQEALDGLTMKFSEQLQQRRNDQIRASAFIYWSYYTKLAKQCRIEQGVEIAGE